CVAGDAPAMPTMGQLNGLVLTQGEELLWSGADRKAFLYVVRAPPARWPRMVIGPPVPASMVGDAEPSPTRIALRVIGMGWVSAVGVTTHLHRNVLRRSQKAPCPAAKSIVYIDSLEIAEGLPKEQAAALGATVPALLSQGSECYAVAGSPSSPGKDVHRAAEVTTLGELIGGVTGTRRPPLSYTTELTGHALWVLGKRRVSRRPMQVPFGRWARVQCFWRPLAAASVNARRWLATLHAGGQISIGVVEALLIAMALAALSVPDVRLEVGPLVAASDASEAAGAAVYSAGLAPRGKLLATRGVHPLNSACEEVVGLISAFSGIDGARRAFEILRLVPACRLSLETDADAVRVVRRVYPATAHLVDVYLAGPAVLAQLLREHGGIVNVLVVGGFPCQGHAVLGVYRKGAADP
ncbi:unnamed protein product, partial [Prorocentrum cordatum]